MCNSYSNKGHRILSIEFFKWLSMKAGEAGKMILDRKELRCWNMSMN